MQIKDSTDRYFRGIQVMTEKNMKIYYTKPPVIIFGLLLPFFMFLAFYLGREIDFFVFFPGLLAMFIFFISTAVGPLITPWEKQAGTYERLLSFPVNIITIIFGDTLAGMIFGIMINLVVLAAGLIFLTYSPNILLLIIGLLLGAFCFSSFGTLLASPPVPNPSLTMMFSSLIRFTLIFISGIFIPLSDLHGIGKILSYFSPVTYLVDIFNFSFKGESDISMIIDFAALFLFSVIFISLTNKIYTRNLMNKG